MKIDKSLDPKALAKRLLALRKKYCLTRERAAEVLDTTVETIRNIEKGRSEPRLSTLRKYEAAFHIPAHRILDPQSKMMPLSPDALKGITDKVWNEYYQNRHIRHCRLRYHKAQQACHIFKST